MAGEGAGGECSGIKCAKGLCVPEWVILLNENQPGRTTPKLDLNNAKHLHTAFKLNQLGLIVYKKQV